MTSRNSFCSIIVVLLAFGINASLARAANPSDPHAIFVPGDQVPLSDFQPAMAGVPITLQVRPEILQWLVAKGHPIEVAVHVGDSVTDVAPDAFAALAGTVTYTPSSDADVVVVSDALVNDFPVVTHWNASLNALGGVGGQPRGGQEVGAADGIDWRDYDPVSGKTIKSSPHVVNDDPAYADPIGGTYVYASNKYAVFSDGTETTPAKDGEPADQAVPGFERYAAENYALTSVSDLLAVWLSDHSRELTGLPIAHRNGHTAFTTGTTPTHRLQPGLPILQVVHCFIVDYDDPNIVGSESSLATFIVPPLWSRAPSEPYPVLFNSFYGIHGSTFATMGKTFLRELGELYTLDGRQAVGILHNGGGALACYTIQGSAVHNAKKLFKQARTLIGIDSDQVVVTGGSRGGISGLHLSFNPFADAFTAPYVIANNPQIYPGDALDTFVNPTYRLVQSGVSGVTGYQNAWKTTWNDPATGLTGPQLTAYNLTGSSNFQWIDANIANGAPGFIAEMLAKNSQIIMRLGTHDFSKSFSHMSRFIEALTVAGVPLRTEIGHRLGHGHALDTQPDERELLNRVIDGTLTLNTGIFHYRPLSVQDELDFVGHPFFPDHAPVFLESPMFLTLGQTHTYTLTGPPSTEYEIRVTPIDKPQWLQGQIVDQWVSPLTVFAGVLPGAAPAVEMTSAVHELDMPFQPALAAPWRFEVRYRLGSGQSWTLLTGETASPPTSYDPQLAPLANLEDPAPVTYVLNLGFPGEVVGFDVDSRTGGLDEDPAL